MRLFKQIDTDIKDTQKKLKEVTSHTEAESLKTNLQQLLKEKKDYEASLKPKVAVTAMTASSELEAQLEMLENPDRWFADYATVNYKYQYQPNIKTFCVCDRFGNMLIEDELRGHAHGVYMNQIRMFNKASFIKAAKMTDRDFDFSIDKWILSEKSKTLSVLKASIKFDGTSDSELRKWLLISTGKKAEDVRFNLDLAVLKHTLTQVKRKLLQLPTKYHMFPVLVSAEHGSGKGTLIELLLKPFDGYSAMMGMDSAMDDRQIKAWSANYVFIIDELADIDRSSIERVKSRMTAQSISGYAPYGRGSITIPNNVTFFGMSNKDVDHFIKDSGMRRFWQIDACETSWKLRELPEADTLIDPYSIWKSIDENDGAKHYIENYEAINTRQKEMATPDSMEVWLSETNVKIEDSANAKYVLVQDLYQHMREQFIANGTVLKSIPHSTSLGRKMAKMGQGKVYKVKNGIRYALYLVDKACLVEAFDKSHWNDGTEINI